MFDSQAVIVALEIMVVLAIIVVVCVVILEKITKGVY